MDLVLRAGLVAEFESNQLEQFLSINELTEDRHRLPMKQMNSYGGKMKTTIKEQ